MILEFIQGKPAIDTAAYSGHVLSTYFMSWACPVGSELFIVHDLLKADRSK